MDYKALYDDDDIAAVVDILQKEIAELNEECDHRAPGDDYDALEIACDILRDENECNKKNFLKTLDENKKLQERLDIAEEYCRDFGIHWNEEKQKYENEDDESEEEEEEESVLDKINKADRENPIPKEGGIQWLTFSSKGELVDKRVTHWRKGK